MSVYLANIVSNPLNLQKSKHFLSFTKGNRKCLTAPVLTPYLQQIFAIIKATLVKNTKMYLKYFVLSILQIHITYVYA